MSPSPAIAVVVATRDRAPRLGRLLESLRAQTLGPQDFEVVVVDDGSRDATRELLAEERQRPGLALRAVRLERPAGPAAARNRGWRACDAPFVAFTDDDCEAAPDWLERCLAAARERPAAVIQGRTLPNPAEGDRLGPFSHTRRVEGPSPWFETCNVVYPRAALERLDGFDETFPEPLGEDTDLGWRALAAGYEHAFDSGALVHHAVEDLGPRRHLGLALRGADAVLVFRRHPELRRRALRWGFIRNSAHARLLVALAGVLVHRRGVALALAAPYLWQLRWRCDEARAPLALAPYFVLFDLLTLVTTLRGDLRHRTVVL